MGKEDKTSTSRFILGLTLLPFQIAGYFLYHVVWKYVARKKSFMEWSLLVLSVAAFILLITAIVGGDFSPSKSVDDGRGRRTMRHNF